MHVVEHVLYRRMRVNLRLYVSMLIDVPAYLDAKRKIILTFLKITYFHLENMLS